MNIAVSKEQTLAIAKSLGVAVPRGLVVRAVGDVPVALKEIGLPAVVKPSESWLWGERGGVRVVSQLVTTADEATCAVAELTRLGGVPFFRGFLPGRRGAVGFLYPGGPWNAGSAQGARRMARRGGGKSFCGRSIPVRPA